MLKIIQRRGSIGFEGLVRLLGGEEYDEENEEAIHSELMALVSEGKVEISYAASGHISYRIPAEPKKHQEFPPVKLMGRAEDPVGAQQLLDSVIRPLMDEDGFTVNQVVKAQEAGGLAKRPVNKIRDLIGELAICGKIVAIKSKRYMGKSYNIYQVTPEVTVKRKLKRG